MKAHYITIRIDAKQYEDHDDSLAAAAADVIHDHPECDGFAMDPRWESEQREVILLDVPAYIESAFPEGAVFRGSGDE